MSSKTSGGLRVIPTLLLAALVAGLVYLAPTLIDDEGSESVSLKVEFRPQDRQRDLRKDGKTYERSFPIQVTVLVEEIPTVIESLRWSPWNKTVKIPKGARLELVAVLPDAGWVSCRINGGPETKREDPGKVVCKHNF